MKKIGRIKRRHFRHPKLSDYPNLEECGWYEIENKLIQKKYLHDLLINLSKNPKKRKNEYI